MSRKTRNKDKPEAGGIEKKEKESEETYIQSDELTCGDEQRMVLEARIKGHQRRRRRRPLNEWSAPKKNRIKEKTDTFRRIFVIYVV